jgi:MscS family membrane protein
MNQRPQPWLGRVLVLFGAVLALGSQTAFSSAEHPLAPPDRSSPRATLTSFLGSVDRAWELYSVGDSAFKQPFRDARDCLDLSDVPPLVFDEFSARRALVLKEVLDRVQLPAMKDMPDSTAVRELDLKRWTVPYTEITLVRIAEGDRQGQWVFSADTVERVEEFYTRVQHLPYQPGRKGGHIEELQAASRAVLLTKLIHTMPPWMSTQVAGMMVWQWFGLVLLVVLLVMGLFGVAWIARRISKSQLLWRGAGRGLIPLALLAVPFVGRAMFDRLFTLPGVPALMVRLAFSIIGSFGLAWLTALVIIRLGDLTVRFWFRDARPLKKQLVLVIFRIATIIVVTVIAVLAMQRLGVPVAGLVAGVGVGGLAIALAAQSTLENFIGGIILYADQPVKVGDVCRFGNLRGTVEDVGLRSVKIRTLDRTIVTVPNADFAKLQLENLSDRDRVLLRENLNLRYETTREQLQEVLTKLESMLREHPRIADDPLRVRFNGFGEYFLEIELFAYALTTAWPEFLEIRQDVLMTVMEIIESSGTRLALPTEVRYAAEFEGSRES